ncbi:hypothetical protein AYO47_04955 [Planctomyces sp. SCGC AG-212-M04]|nr:hypothetical protein AYO47_04955 [Planctomyces sp. SCGC AG-212-M04]
MAQPRRRREAAPAARQAEVLLARTLPSATVMGPTVAEGSLSDSPIGEALNKLGLHISFDGGSDQGDGDHGSLRDSLNAILDSLNLHLPEDFEDFKSLKQSWREIRQENREARREHRQGGDGDSSGGGADLSQLKSALHLPKHTPIGLRLK